MSKQERSFVLYYRDDDVDAPPLVAAAWRGEIATVETLLKTQSPHQADARGRSALLWAIHESHESIVVALINAGASIAPEIRTSDDLLSCFMRCSSISVVRAIANICPIASLPRERVYAWMHALISANRTDIFEQLVADLFVLGTALEDEGLYALHHACRTANLALGQYCLYLGYGENTRNLAQMTPLDLIHHHPKLGDRTLREDLRKILEQRGGKVNVYNFPHQFETRVGDAIEIIGCDELTRKILEQPAHKVLAYMEKNTLDVHSTDSHGCTALFWAAYRHMYFGDYTSVFGQLLYLGASAEKPRHPRVGTLESLARRHDAGQELLAPLAKHIEP